MKTTQRIITIVALAIIMVAAGCTPTQTQTRNDYSDVETLPFGLGMVPGIAGNNTSNSQNTTNKTKIIQVGGAKVISLTDDIDFLGRFRVKEAHVFTIEEVNEAIRKAVNELKTEDGIKNGLTSPEAVTLTNSFSQQVQNCLSTTARCKITGLIVRGVNTEIGFTSVRKMKKPGHTIRIERYTNGERGNQFTISDESP